MLTHDNRMYVNVSGCNVGFGGRHSNYDEWLQADLNFCTPKDVRNAVSGGSSSKGNVGSCGYGC